MTESATNFVCHVYKSKEWGIHSKFRLYTGEFDTRYPFISPGGGGGILH